MIDEITDAVRELAFPGLARRLVEADLASGLPLETAVANLRDVPFLTMPRRAPAPLRSRRHNPMTR